LRGISLDQDGHRISGRSNLTYDQFVNGNVPGVADPDGGIGPRPDARQSAMLAPDVWLQPRNSMEGLDAYEK
jgi:hypothetical protein